MSNGAKIAFAVLALLGIAAIAFLLMPKAPAPPAANKPAPGAQPGAAPAVDVAGIWNDVTDIVNTAKPGTL